MYENIGNKIKGLASFLAVAGIIASVILGIIDIVNAVKLGKYASSYGNVIAGVQGVTVWGGILKIILGSIISVVSTYVLYGFGQLVDSAQNLERELVHQPTTKLSHAKPIENETAKGWKCPRCGRMNAMLMSKCECGESKPRDTKSSTRSAAGPEWQCPQCLKINPSYVTTCGCGTPKHMGTILQPNRNAAVGADEWQCPSCGKVNSVYVGTCGCGERRP